VTHEWWWLVVDALATYRLTILVTRDAITEPLRRGRRAIFWACTWCTSIWIAAVVVALTRFWPTEWQYPAMLLALSAVAGYMGERS
jgi:hypothetical protein